MENLISIAAFVIMLMTSFISLVMYSRSILTFLLVVGIICGYWWLGFHLNERFGILATFCVALGGLVVAAVYGVATDDTTPSE